MTGLFRCSLYQAKNSMKLLLAVIVLDGAAVFITGNSTLREIFIYISISMFAALGVSGMRGDAACQWDRYEVTLPLRRREIVRCKYLIHLFWTAAGGVVAGLFVGATALLHGAVDLSSEFSLGIGIAVIMGALFYPATLLFGTDKSETILSASMIAALALAMGLIQLVNLWGWPSAVRLCVFTLVYVLAYGISYLVSVEMYKRKEI